MSYLKTKLASCLRYGAGSGRRGSVLILVVGVLVMLMLLGTAYIQSSRKSYKTASMINHEHIDAVAAKTIDQIARILREDLQDHNGVFFNPLPVQNGWNKAGDETYDYPRTNLSDMTRGPSNPNWFQIVTVFGGTGQAFGGHLDDMWLASTVPDYEYPNDPCPAPAYPRDPRWAHITNLNGLFIRLNDLSGVPLANPVEDVLDHQNGYTTDTNLPVTGNFFENIMADADGDGFNDSRWTWAPLREVGGIQYVVAVRIIDNSSMVNLNAATAMTSDGGTGYGSGGNAPRGYYPTNIDLSRLLSRADAVERSSGQEAVTWAVELEELLKYRGMATVLPTTYANTVNGWFNGALMYGYSHNKVQIGDELELRYRGGLDREDEHAIEAQIMYDPALPNHTPQSNILRTGAMATGETEAGYEKGDAHYHITYDDHLITPEGYFQGYRPVPPLGADPLDPIEDRVFPALRHVLTTKSGSVMYANWDYLENGVPVAVPVYKYDLFNDDGGASENNNARVNAIMDRLLNVFRVGDVDVITTPGIVNGYLGYETTGGSVGDNELMRMAGEFAMAIQDYTDSDFRPSTMYIDYDGNGSQGGGDEQIDYYGLEAMPFVREVYAEIGYEDLDEWDAVMEVLGQDGVYDQWSVVDGSQAMAIEICNPFDHDLVINVDPLELGLDANKLDLRIVIQGWGGSPFYISNAAFDRLTIAETVPDSGVETVIPLTDITISAGGCVVIYSDPSSVPILEDDGVLDQRGNHLTDIGFASQNPDCILKAQTNGLFDFGGSTLMTGSDVTLELQVWVSPGVDTIYGTADDEWITYDRFSLDGLNFTNTNSVVNHGDNPNDPTLPWPVHAQGSVARGGVGVSCMTNCGKGIVTGLMRIPTALTGHSGYKWTSNVPIDRLGQDAKGMTVPMAVQEFQIPHTDGDIRNITELAWIMMVGFYNDPANPDVGDIPQRLSGTDGSGGMLVNYQTASDELFLNYDFTNPVPDSTGVTHAAMVLDQFIAYSPRDPSTDYDNADGDNDPNTGTNDADEFFIPGTLNINTVPLHIAVLAGPIPEAVGDVEDLMRAVFAYRDIPEEGNLGLDDPGRTPAYIDPLVRPADTAVTVTNRTIGPDLPLLVDNYRQGRGIETIGELLTVLPNGLADIDQSYGMLCTMLTAPRSSVYDLYPDPASSPKSYDTDGPEELMGRFQFLNQTFTTRSDIFTAYILVRGYAEGKFDEGPVEQKRYVAVMDRSNLGKDLNGDGVDDIDVRIIGILEY